MEPANPLHAEIRRHVREVQRTRRATNRMPADALVIRDGLMLKTRFFPIPHRFSCRIGGNGRVEVDRDRSNYKRYLRAGY